MRVATVLSLLLACGVLGCSSAPPKVGATREAPPKPSVLSRQRVRALRAQEAAVREGISPREQPPWVDVSGSDPYRITARVGEEGFVGILRGSKALVTLGADLEERTRVPLPETPTALCVTVAGDAWVAGRYGRSLLRVQLGQSGATAITLRRELPMAGVADLACADDGVVHVLPADGSELLTLDRTGHELGSFQALPGGLRLLRRGSVLFEVSLFERSLRALELGPRGVPTRELGRLQHDGTLWALDATDWGSGGPLVAVVGAEDKPLVRAHGEFENIDSYLWLYRLEPAGFTFIAELNVSDFGLVVPKALHFREDDARLTLDVLAAGSGRLLHATWGSGLGAPPSLRVEPAPPGASDAVFGRDGSVTYASPLYDAWGRLERASNRLVRVDPERGPELDVRLGEALFFTDLMAPENTSAGSHSRFSCETCHWEGGVDGRRHYTGRADVSVVTKPLFGLANNRPHFSRAMDPDLSSVSHNEFRVAGAGSGTDPWFVLATSRFPWLHQLGVHRAELAPLELRMALLRFLYAFSPAPNPSSQSRQHFSKLEAEGARAFRERCVSCHAARLLSDDPASEPFGEWEASIFSRNAPLVWAKAEYAKTGVVPYVHEQGTRIPSLRRLASKPRYFTNGSASSLDDVLARFRDGPAGALHDAPAGTGQPLSRSTQQALVAFLELL
ncbi:MAG TPA: hypothetical protein VHP33_28530 [Polyangiaceae bacterium]|nr:hypothetical protein [Polyangiaceae bacterium]